MNDPIDSRQLQVFVVLAKRGSLRDAAAELFLTSSAISHSVRTLEENLGTKLFHRPGKFLELTAKGQYLLKEASAILEAMELVRCHLNSDDTTSRAPLRVAVGYNFLSCLFPEILREWQLCFPQGKILARAAERDACIELLNDDAVDAAILIDPPVNQDYNIDLLFEDELRLVVAGGTALAQTEPITLRSLNNKTLLVSRMQSHTTKMILNEMRHHGLHFHECIEVGSTDAIYEMVKAGQGIAFQPEWALDRQIENRGVVAKVISGSRLLRRWAFLSRAGKHRNVMERTLLRLCRTFSENIAA